MSVIYPSLIVSTIPTLRGFLAGRPEEYARNVYVSNRTTSGADRMVTLHQGPGVGATDTLDDTTLRVNIYARDEGDAEDLAILVRYFFEARTGGLVDGKPVTASSISGGPIEIPNETALHQWYFVADIQRRGIELA